MLIGIIIAFCSKEIELIDTTILDGNAGTTPIGITLHVIVILAFTLVSAILLYIANRMDSTCSLSQKKNLIFHILYVAIGLFFSIASGCSERSHHLSEYYNNIHSKPSWYMQDIINMRGFNNIPKAADTLSNIATVFYILTVIGIIALALFYFKTLEEKQN